MFTRARLFILVSVGLSLVLSVPAHALTGTDVMKYTGLTKADQTCTFTSMSGLLNNGKVFTSGCTGGDLVAFINALDTFFYRLAIVLAVLMITIGGMQWLMAIGNSSKISNAKDTIQQAVIGLILAMTAILLFNQIDPSFTNLKGPTLVTSTFSCETIQDPSSCIAQAAANSCKWTCTDPSESKKRVLPPNTKWTSDFQNPLCIPGKCTTGVTTAGGAANAATCDNTSGLAAQYGTNPNLTNSPQLNALIQCVNSSPAGALLGPDSNQGTWESAQHNTKCNFTRGNPICGPCVHAVNSCHYGGKTGNNGAEAVDFNAADGSPAGEAALCRALRAASAGCNFGFLNFEGNHTHVSTASCDGDGTGIGTDCPS